MKGENRKYDHALRTEFTLAEAENLVGYRCRLPLTGVIVSAGESDAGAYVKFKIDERWGFPTELIACDIEALDHLRER